MSKQELTKVNKLTATLLIVSITALIGGCIAAYYAHKCDDILKTILLNRAFTLGMDIALACSLISVALFVLNICLTKNGQTER